MAVPPAPVRIPSQRPLAPSVVSVISVANGISTDLVGYFNDYDRDHDFIICGRCTISGVDFSEFSQEFLGFPNFSLAI